MRLEPGLQFDPACDEQPCADFDPIRPATECMESCRNLFIPRLMPGDDPLRPASGICDEKISALRAMIALRTSGAA